MFVFDINMSSYLVMYRYVVFFIFYVQFYYFRIVSKIIVQKVEGVLGFIGII